MMFTIASATTAAAGDVAVDRDGSAASTIAALLQKDPVKPPAPTKPPADLRDRQDEAKKRAQEEARRRAQDEAKKRAQEEARRRAQDEAKKRAQEEARRRAQEEAKRRAAEQARQRAQDEAKQRAAEQARQRAQEEARQRAAEQARQRSQEQARQRAAEQARERAQQEARERAAEQARRRAMDEARERAAAQARERAQEQARDRAADLARERAQQEARQRALDDARRRAEAQARDQAADEARRRAAEARSRELVEETQRNRAEDLARQRAMDEARQRAIEEAQRRNAQDLSRERDVERGSSRGIVPPPFRNTDARSGEPIRVDPEAASALDRAVKSARERAEARLERERAQREAESTRNDPGVIRITPRHSAESLEPVQPGEVRITPSRGERFEVLREPESRNRSLSATSAAEASKREVQREMDRERESIQRGTTVPTRAYLEREVDLPPQTGGGLTLPGNSNGSNGGSGNAFSQGGTTFAQPGGANAIVNRGQLPIQRYAPNHSDGGSSNYRNDYGDDWHDDYRYDDDYDDFYDHRHWKYGHRSYRDYCDDFGYRRYRFYDHWGYDRSCSPWFSFHIFYGYRWRAYCDPYWDWWIRPGYSFRFYYDYGSPYHYRPWYTDVRYVTTYQTVYRTEVEYIEVPVPTPPPALTANDAWRMVSEGYYREARNVFSRLSIERPDDGTLRIGYAIASGLEYDAGAAVFAMRRALELDPISVRLVPVDSVLRRRVLDLVDHFAAESRRNEFDRDALFMVAALNTVIGEDGLAFFAIDRAIDLGDEAVSTYNLDSIIRQRMEERMGSGR